MQLSNADQQAVVSSEWPWWVSDHDDLWSLFVYYVIMFQVYFFDSFYKMDPDQDKMVFIVL